MMSDQTEPMSASAEVSFAEVEAARHRIADCLAPTPLAPSEYLSKLWGSRIYLKFENLQMTGSFKERGALNKMLCLGQTPGVITASAGNHGQAVAYHARRLNIPATVVMPVNSPLIKVQNSTSYGARVILHGTNYDEAVAHARQLCAQEQLTYIPGFDDRWVIAGQGTIGLELLEQCPYLDHIIVPVGGGGLIAGIALAMKETNPRIRIIGVQSERVPSMLAALEKGETVTVPPQRTIADGIAVRQVGKLPLALVKKYVDEIVTVSEAEIASAILLMLEREKTVVEGAGAVGIAALNSGRIQLSGHKVACVLSGGNIDVNLLSRIIDKGLVKDGRMVKLRVKVPDYPGQLSRILDMVADSRANILDVMHSRAFSAAQVGETVIDLVLETRGLEHIDQLLAMLEGAGFHATRQGE